MSIFKNDCLDFSLHFNKLWQIAYLYKNCIQNSQNFYDDSLTFVLKLATKSTLLKPFFFFWVENQHLLRDKHHVFYLKDEERSPGKGSNDEKNGTRNPILVTDSSGLCRGIGLRVMHMLRPHKINDTSFVKCHQHGSSHCHYCSHHLCLASNFLHVQLLHPIHPNKHKFMLIQPI